MTNVELIANMGFRLVGGLGIFLLGMKYMQQGLQVIAGSRIRRMISAITSNRFLAVGVGLFVTTLVQSSSVTSVMVIGLVNSELMALTEAIGVIIGANIGTTITGWILALKIGQYGLPLLGVAAFGWLFLKTERSRYVSLSILGVGMVFFGLEVMKDGFTPVRELPDFVALFQLFEATDYPGAHRAGVVRHVGDDDRPREHRRHRFSDRGRRGAGHEYRHNHHRLPGICRGGRHQCQTYRLLSHFLQRVRCGRGHGPVPSPLHAVHRDGRHGRCGSGRTGRGRELSLYDGGTGHRAHRVQCGHRPGVHSICLADREPTASTRQRPTRAHQSAHDASGFSSRQLAADRYRAVASRDPANGRTCARHAERFASGDHGGQRRGVAQKIFQQENTIDEVQIEVTTFLTELLAEELSHDVADEARMQLRLADEFESVSDDVSDILKLYLRMRDAGVRFTDTQQQELVSLHDLVASYYDSVRVGLEHVPEDYSPEILHESYAITGTIRELRDRHWHRLSEEKVAPLVSTSYMDIANSYRRMKDHLLNIGEAVIGGKTLGDERLTARAS